MAGTFTGARQVRHVIRGYSEWSCAGTVGRAIILNQWLVEEVCLFDCRIGAIKAYAQVAGSGAGNTVLDVYKNGTSIFDTAANRPTLLGTSTGEFTSLRPDSRTVKYGDVIGVQVVTVPATTAHDRVMFAMTLEDPIGALLI